ncbi:MAG: DUF2730 family protein [Burkholderiales bacterium]|nr:DUF2730 family protein [Burkholderiales bacterium]
MNWPAIYITLFAVQWLFNAALAAWLYLRKADDGNTESVKALAKELATFIHASEEANAGQNDRLTALETNMDHMPSGEEIAELREGVASMRAAFDGMTKAVERMAHQNDIIYRHLLDKR